MKQRKSEKRGCPLAEGLISVRKCDGKVPEKKKRAVFEEGWSLVQVVFHQRFRLSKKRRRLVSRPSGLSSEVSPEKKSEQSLKKAGLSSKWSFIRGFASVLHCEMFCALS